MCDVGQDGNKGHAPDAAKKVVKDCDKEPVKEGDDTVIDHKGERTLDGEEENAKIFLFQFLT